MVCTALILPVLIALLSSWLEGPDQKGSTFGFWLAKTLPTGVGLILVVFVAGRTGARQYRQAATLAAAALLFGIGIRFITLKLYGFPIEVASLPFEISGVIGLGIVGACLLEQTVQQRRRS